MESMNDDSKYVTFKREDFEKYIYGQGAPPYKTYELEDAVVIRRQDLFAAPALNAYASCIAIAAKLADEGVKQQLLGVADYFHRQAELAADEGWKLPS